MVGICAHWDNKYVGQDAANADVDGATELN